MKCPKCDGKGWRRNPKWTGGGCDVYPISYPCRYCGESGYVIGNVRDVLNYLKGMQARAERSGDKRTSAELKRCISIIEKN